MFRLLLSLHQRDVYKGKIYIYPYVPDHSYILEQYICIYLYVNCGSYRCSICYNYFLFIIIKSI
jgi:hypothetical protein